MILQFFKGGATEIGIRDEFSFLRAHKGEIIVFPRRIQNNPQIFVVNFSIRWKQKLAYVCTYVIYYKVLFFSYFSSIPSSPYSETAKSSGHGTASSSLSSTSSTSYPHSSRPQAVPQRVSRHASFLVTSPPKMAANPPGMGFESTPINKRSSFAGGEARSLFHLSMPDIAANNKDQEKTIAPSGKTSASEGPAAAPRQWTHNRKAQHRHFKAKMNLNPKLEAVRKHSSDSATSSGGGSVVCVDDNTVITGSGGHPTSRPSNCDSGLGTPVSLLDEMAVSATSSSLGGSTGHNSSSQGSGQLSKWRSSMSGKEKENLS